MAEEAALLLIGHGTRSRAGVGQYWELAAAVRARAPGLALGGGFIELAEPSLDAAVDQLVAAGAASIVAVPLVLLGAGHMKDDGPAALARGRRRHPSVRFAYGRELGVHPLLVAAAELRAREAVTAAAALDGEGDGGWSVALIGRGSSDPDANADLFKVARLLEDSRGFAGVEAGFVSLAAPSVGEVLERCYRLGSTRVVVVPYFLFAGVLVDRIHAQAAEWAAARPGVQVCRATEMGPVAGVASLVVERYREAAGGAVRMNCDCCAYRVALPGYEAKVGRPVVVHAHHHATDRREHAHDEGGR